jgi:hypothetical protein
MASVNKSTVSTVRFQVLYVLRLLPRERRRILHSDVTAMGIKEVLCAPRAPWQKAYVECEIGSIRREYPAQVTVFHEASLYRHMKSFVA